MVRLRAFSLVAAIVGDITPVDGVSDEDKHQLEAAAMARIRDMLGSDTAAGRHSTPREHWRCTRHAYHHDGFSECSTCPERASSSGQEVEELWQEYESATTPEAMLVKDFDKVRVPSSVQNDGSKCRPHSH